MTAGDRRRALALRTPVAAIIGLVAFALSVTSTGLADGDLPHAYANVKPALVKVWAFDAQNIPEASGTGFVVQSDARTSWIITAAHVIEGSSHVRVDVSRDVHDLPASILARTPSGRDLVLLEVPHGNLPSVHFPSSGGSLSEGSSIATAGYFQNDDQLGITGQYPQTSSPV